MLLLAAVLQATWLKQDAHLGWWFLPIGVLIGVRSSDVLTFSVFAVACWRDWDGDSALVQVGLNRPMV